MRRLLIRPGAIGDCILTLPALAHLWAEYTEVWVPSVVVPLIQFVDDVLPLASTGIDLIGVGDLKPEEHFGPKIRRFDDIVSWYGANRPEFRAALEAYGVPCQFHQALPSADYKGHATDFFAGQVGAPRGLVPHIAVGDVVRRETIVIHPFSGAARKNWPLSSYLELASRLPYPVEWTAGPEEQLPGANRFNNLLELAQWIHGARLYIGNDSGITHLAAATGTPVLALFGPTPPELWGPRGRNIMILRNNPISQLTLETVLQTALGLLE